MLPWHSLGMWIDLYVVVALIAAVAAWLVSPHFESYDPPSDIARGFWSAAAGALWPLIVFGAVQILAVRYVVRHLGPTPTEQPDRVPQLKLSEASLIS
jgi:hypothetical protein